jgi:hypothetical protein
MLRLPTVRWAARAAAVPQCQCPLARHKLARRARYPPTHACPRTPSSRRSRVQPHCSLLLITALVVALMPVNGGGQRSGPMHYSAACCATWPRRTVPRTLRDALRCAQRTKCIQLAAITWRRAKIGNAAACHAVRAAHSYVAVRRSPLPAAAQSSCSQPGCTPLLITALVVSLMPTNGGGLRSGPMHYGVACGACCPCHAVPCTLRGALQACSNNLAARRNAPYCCSSTSSECALLPAAATVPPLCTPYRCPPPRVACCNTPCCCPPPTSGMLQRASPLPGPHLLGAPGTLLPPLCALWCHAATRLTAARPPRGAPCPFPPPPSAWACTHKPVSPLPLTTPDKGVVGR